MTTDELQPDPAAAEAPAPEAMSEWERCLQGIDPKSLKSFVNLDFTTRKPGEK